MNVLDEENPIFAALGKVSPLAMFDEQELRALSMILGDYCKDTWDQQAQDLLNKINKYLSSN